MTKDTLTPTEAFEELMSTGDIVQLRHGFTVFVAPLTDAALERLVTSYGIREDIEDDDPGGETTFRGPAGATVDDEPGGEDEPSLGWTNGYHADNQSTLTSSPDDLESDDDCDREEDDPSGDPLDKGELDPCDLGEPDDTV